MDQYEWKDYVDSGPNHRKVVMRTRDRAQARKWGIVSLDWIKALNWHSDRVRILVMFIDREDKVWSTVVVY